MLINKYKMSRKRRIYKMDYKEIYESWLSNPYFDEETKAELKAIADDDNVFIRILSLVQPDLEVLSVAVQTV